MRADLCTYVVFILQGALATGQSFVDSYNLMTSSESGGIEFESRVYNVDIQSGGSMVVDSTTGNSATYNVPSTDAATVSVTYDTFDLQLDSQTAALRVQFYSDDTSVTDGYFPLPSACLGSSYVISTGLPVLSGSSFIGVRNTDVTTTLTVALHDQLDIEMDVAGSTLQAGDSRQITLQPNEILTMTSTSHALDGVSLSSSNNISVYAGNWEVTLLGFGVPNTLIEMVPPTSFFSAQYVVCLPTGVSLATVKIIALHDNTDVTITSVPAVGTPSTSTNTLSFVGDVWTYTQGGAVLVSAVSPVMVTQYLPEQSFDTSPSMTLVPPVEEWASSYLLYPLQPENDGTHEANVVIETQQVSGLTATKLADNEDVTNTLSFSKISTTQYSMARVILNPSYVLRLHHSDGTAFQVIQYGGLGSSTGAYSFPAGMKLDCRYSNTSSVSTNSGSSSSFLQPGRTVYYITGGVIVGTLLLIVIVTLIVASKKKSASYATASLDSRHPAVSSNGWQKSGDRSSAFFGTLHMVSLTHITSGSTPPADSRLIRVQPAI